MSSSLRNEALLFFSAISRRRRRRQLSRALSNVIALQFTALHRCV